jgi:hypothetical protein
MLKVEEPIWNRSSLGCHVAPIKYGSSISPISVNGIHQAERRQVNFDYLAYNLMFFFARKAVDACHHSM